MREIRKKLDAILLNAFVKEEDIELTADKIMLMIKPHLKDEHGRSRKRTQEEVSIKSVD